MSCNRFLLFIFICITIAAGSLWIVYRLNLDHCEDEECMKDLTRKIKAVEIIFITSLVFCFLISLLPLLEYKYIRQPNLPIHLRRQNSPPDSPPLPYSPPYHHSHSPHHSPSIIVGQIDDLP